MSQMQSLTRLDQIEGRIDRTVVGTIGVSAQQGMAITSMGQAMEFAKLMAVSDKAVPAHLRGNPGACLAIAIQGYEWGVNPFAIANKSYVVNDRIGYESALYHAVVLRRAPISGRVRTTYQGEGQNRRCHVEATLADGTGNVDYTSPALGTIPTKNSPLWKGDVDQQLFYYSVRAFARRHFPDVMMGIYTADELIDATPMGGTGTTTVSEAPARGMKALMDRVTSKPVSEGQEFVPEPSALAEAAAAEQAADALPADHQAIEDGTEDQQLAAPDPARLTTAEGFIDAIAEAAQDAKLGESEVNAWVAKQVKLLTKKNRAEDLTFAQRTELVAKVAGGTLD